MNKVYGGTLRSDRPPMCVTCRHAQIMKRQTGEDVTLCRIDGMTPFQITIPVVECNDYDDARQASKWDMEKIAWRLSVDLKHKSVGFFSPLEWKKRVDSGKEGDD